MNSPVQDVVVLPAKKSRLKKRKNTDEETPKCLPAESYPKEKKRNTKSGLKITFSAISGLSPGNVYALPSNSTKNILYFDVALRDTRTFKKGETSVLGFGGNITGIENCLVDVTNVQAAISNGLQVVPTDVTTVDSVNGLQIYVYNTTGKPIVLPTGTVVAKLRVFSEKISFDMLNFESDV